MQEQNEPGAVITPGATASFAPQPQDSTSLPSPQPIVPSPQSATPTVSPPQFSAEPVAPMDPPPNATAYSAPVQSPQVDEFAQQDGLLMTWQTQETDEHDKQGRWYASVTLVAVLLTGVVFFLTEKDILVSVAVFLSVLGFAYLASHKPKEQQYALTQEGIYVGDKHRLYEEFKNFSQVEEASGPTIILIPHKRFASPLVLKLTHDTVDAAVDTLARFLPVEERKPDAIDQLVRRIRL